MLQGGTTIRHKSMYMCCISCQQGQSRLGEPMQCRKAAQLACMRACMHTYAQPRSSRVQSRPQMLYIKCCKVAQPAGKQAICMHLTIRGTETIMRVCTAPQGSTADRLLRTCTHSMPAHTRLGEDYESVCSTEKQHSQQAYELQVHIAPLAI